MICLYVVIFAEKGIVPLRLSHGCRRAVIAFQETSHSLRPACSYERTIFGVSSSLRAPLSPPISRRRRVLLSFFSGDRTTNVNNQHRVPLPAISTETNPRRMARGRTSGKKVKPQRSRLTLQKPAIRFIIYLACCVGCQFLFAFVFLRLVFWEIE